MCRASRRISVWEEKGADASITPMKYQSRAFRMAGTVNSFFFLYELLHFFFKKKDCPIIFLVN